MTTKNVSECHSDSATLTISSGENPGMDAIWRNRGGCNRERVLVREGVLVLLCCMKNAS